MKIATRTFTWALFFAIAGRADGGTERSIEVPINEAGELRVDEIVTRLARASGIDKALPPMAPLSLSTRGLARGLTSTFLTKALGPEIVVTFRPGAATFTFDERILAPGRRNEWLERLEDLGARTVEASRQKNIYGMRSLPSYRPNDPARPTICLVHGLNSSSGGFVHMVPWLEQAGYGIVAYDYPFNQKLEDSCAEFARDWKAFRQQTGEQQPWVIVAHSMGCLVARSMVENDATWANDVSSLALIAPVNQGSQLAKVQTAVQLLNGIQGSRGKKSAQAMLHLSQGLGQSAQDMLPGSTFLTKLNSRPRRREVSYHILAGDRGILNPEARAQIEAQLALLTRNAGLFANLTKTITSDFPDILSELTDGTGDGCVAVDRTRLDGVRDWSVMHANHAELIRAPLLFSDPGPVACMPPLLRWLQTDRDRNTR